MAAFLLPFQVRTITPVDLSFSFDPGECRIMQFNACICVRARAYVCVRACVRACMCACVRALVCVTEIVSVRVSVREWVC